MSNVTAIIFNNLNSKKINVIGIFVTIHLGTSDFTDEICTVPKQTYGTPYLPEGQFRTCIDPR